MVNIAINTKCQLIVEQASTISPTSGSAYVELLYTNLVDPKETLKISMADYSNTVPDVYTYTLPADGLYEYHLLKLPKLSEHDESSPYHVFKEDGLVYKGVTLVEDFKKLVEDLQGSGQIIEDEPIFALCRIERCLTTLQEKFIYSKRYTANNCNTTLTAKQWEDREFLFSSVFILRELIQQQRFIEATDLLNFITTCNSVCNTASVDGCSCMKVSSSCGCNK